MVSALSRAKKAKKGGGIELASKLRKLHKLHKLHELRDASPDAKAMRRNRERHLQELILGNWRKRQPKY